MRVNVGGSLKPVVRAKVNIGGSLKTIVRSKVNVGDVLKVADTFLQPLTLSASPSSVNGYSASSPVVTDSTTATPSGGLGPYTYSWARLSGSGTATAPTTATTAFYDSLSPGFLSSGTFRCTVTDSLGSTATADVVAEYERFDI